ncbi:MAG: 2-oxo acid dehydrogenase subunit E2 [Ideonella sp.]|nr:2-oxo acid dehydrogenase subunit E2 [Ideonella sp.]
MQRIAAERLLRSHLETAPVTLLGEAECDALVAARADQRRARGGRALLVPYLLVEAVAQALREHPALNCALIDGELHQYETVNLGVAIALPDGNLVVPVLRDAGSKPLAAIVRELGDLEARAAAGRSRSPTSPVAASRSATPARWRCAGRRSCSRRSARSSHCAIRRAPVARGDRVEVAWAMPTSLTFDHRAVNGLPASRFVETLHGLLGAPARIDFGPEMLPRACVRCPEGRQSRGSRAG